MHSASWARMPTYPACAIIAFFACAPIGLALGVASVGKAADESDGIATAKSVAAMLSAGLIVISNAQDLINNPDVGDKGLDGKSVLEQVQKLFRETTGSDPSAIDPNQRHGRLLRVE